MIWYRDFFEHGCRECGHGSAEPLYLHARCHMESPVCGKLVVERRGQAAVKLECCECGEPVGTVAIEPPPPQVQQLVRDHGHLESSRTYLYFRGDLFIMCDECREPVGIFPVKAAKQITLDKSSKIDED